MAQSSDVEARHPHIVVDKQSSKREPARHPRSFGRLASDLIVKWGFIVITVLLIVFFSLANPSFIGVGNIFQMLKSIVPMGIAGLGLTITLAITGIDLSVGSVAGLSVSLAAWTMVIADQTAPVAIGVTLLAGAVLGGLNAFLITVARIPDLLATLATMFGIVGLQLVIVNGQSISSNMSLPGGGTAPGKFTPGFLWLNNGSVGPVPVPVIILAVLTIMAWVFLDHTRWGRALYAIGGNTEAAHLAGIPVVAYKIFAYVMCGLFASIAGLILAAQTGQGDVSAGGSLLMNAIAVSFISVSVLGLARPNAWGTALGALLVGVLTTGLTMIGFPYYVQDLVEGIVLVVALLFSFTLARKKTVMVAGSFEVPN